MPITEEEWDRGFTKDSTEASIINLLNENFGKAFSLDEIAREINEEPKKVGQALKALEQLGEIESKEIRTAKGIVKYYRIKKRKKKRVDMRASSRVDALIKCL